VEWREVRGSGVEARLVDMTVAGTDAAPAVLRLGSLPWLEAAGVDVERARTFSETWAQQGATVIGWAEGSRLLALFALRDTLKRGADKVIGRLHRMGFRVGMITGDRAEVARVIAGQLGLDGAEVLAGVRPEEKAARIRALQARGDRVAFVGDGINDAPALEQADLGIAVARATDIARESADMILLRADLEAVPEALGLAQASLRTIHQNLFWAFFYNAAAVPLAALGFLSPILCALAMGLSDLIVIGNALRLRRWRLAVR
jgi:Cu+-exporting ATPase